MSYLPRSKMLFGFICLFSFLAIGCGQKVKDSVKPVDTTMIRNPNPCVRLVMLPFADYSSGRHLDDSLRRQIKIQTAISYNLASRGYYLPVEEDVVQYLVDLGVINLIETQTVSSRHNRKSFYRELGSGWSADMKKEINNILLQNELMNVPEEELKMNMIGLNKNVIKQIGEYFGADFVLRGRIVEYEMREGQDLNPLQQGILPFFFDWTSATIFGVAQSEKYDLWQNLAIGGAMGAGLGSMANTPFNAPTESSHVVGTHPRFAHVVTETSGGYTNSALLNAGVWGAAGMAAAYLASKGGHVPKAVVQISLALQDTETGQVVWANRVEKEVEPISMWADPSDRKNMDRAIEEATKALLTDLTNTLALCNKCQPAGTCEEPQIQQAATVQPIDNIQSSPTTSGQQGIEPVQQLELPKKHPENWGS